MLNSNEMTPDAEDSTVIENILFCVFDNRSGPQIVYQVPESKACVDSDDFHSIQNYMIPKEELQQKLITVKAFGHKILGCPAHIDSEKTYVRNAFKFNVCFVFKPNANTTCYEKVLKKLVQYLTVLEEESDYLSSIFPENRKPNMPAKQKDYITPLKNVLELVVENLNTTGCCTIPIDEANTIHLKLVPCFGVPAQIHDHDVPYLTIRIDDYHTQQWDLATQQILPVIDGFKHVALIAAESNKDVQLVKALIQNLLYYKLVIIIPIFQYSNVYMVTSDIQKLYRSKDLQNRCMQAVKLPGHDMPTFDNIFKVYSCFTHGQMTTVKQVCIKLQPHELDIEVRKLIQFGVINKFIRRIHKYPVRTRPVSESGSSQIMKFCDGLHSYDEICCALGLSYEELDAKVEEEASIMICWK